MTGIKKPVKKNKIETNKFAKKYKKELEDVEIDIPNLRIMSFGCDLKNKSFFDRNANRITLVLTLINIVLFASMVWVNCY